MINSVTNNANPQLAQKANEFLGQVFWGTLLREFRKSQQSGLFDTGFASGVFFNQFDQEIARRISSSGKIPMADVLLQKLEGQSFVLRNKIFQDQTMFVNREKRL